MKAKPMLCKGSVVRAILDGRQTQDRRLIKAQPPVGDLSKATIIPDDGTVIAWKSLSGLHIPNYQPGDIIWVRETSRVASASECFVDPSRSWWSVDYLARGAIIGKGKLPGKWFPKISHRADGEIAWSPSIFMPKWACRLFLKVVAVRVERIQDISIEDCIAEGVGGEETPCPVRSDKIHSDAWYDGEGCEACGAPSVKVLFHDLWESIYPGSWERNEWVWVTEFERTDKPADWPTAN